ncbi:unnamed protein product [Cochlearia groenlandica]
MASSSSSFLLLLLAIITVSSFSISPISALPCRTFLISSYSFSITPENPNLDSDLTSSSSSSRSVTVFTIRRLNPHHTIPLFVNRRHEKPHQIRSDLLSFPFIDSFKDRTRDILSVVVALLFGVGCGALTAATMYLAWALVVNRRSYDSEEEEEEEECYENEESDEACLKKMGYVKIPPPVKESA